MNNYRASMQELEMFAAIAQHLSFRKAAEERNVTPSSLSHAMRNFEERWECVCCTAPRGKWR
jgi:transcriptional regulator, LysR family